MSNCNPAKGLPSHCCIWPSGKTYILTQTYHHFVPIDMTASHDSVLILHESEGVCNIFRHFITFYHSRLSLVQPMI